MLLAHLRQIPRVIQHFVKSCDNAETKPSLLKIGAHDGITGDPLGESIRTSEHWTANLVEPVPEIHALLKQNYADERRFKCHALAIGVGTDSAVFYSVDADARRSLPDLPRWSSQLGSFVPGHIERCLGDRIKPFIRETVVSQLTLATFMRSNQMSCPTLLHIDTEGLDYEVLKTYDFAAGGPRVILVEHKHLSDADKSHLLDVLCSHNYSLVLESKSDFAAFLHSDDAIAACVGATSYHPQGENADRRPLTRSLRPDISQRHLQPPRPANPGDRRDGPAGAARSKRSAPAAPDMGDDFEDLYGKCKAQSMASAERMFALFLATRYVIDADITGAFVECGVWRGGSMMMVALTLLHAGVSDRDLYLFDTFEGMPKPDEAKDVDLKGRRAIEEWRQRSGREHGSEWALASLEQVRANLAATGYPADRIHMIKGMVEETIPSKAPDRIALLRLDTDWYSSTRHELECLYPLLSQDGVLIIDDYGHYKGARQATDEYFANRGHKGLLNRIDYTGRLLIKTLTPKGA